MMNLLPIRSCRNFRFPSIYRFAFIVFFSVSSLPGFFPAAWGEGSELVFGEIDKLTRKERDHAELYGYIADANGIMHPAPAKGTCMQMCEGLAQERLTHCETARAARLQECEKGPPVLSAGRDDFDRCVLAYGEADCRRSWCDPGECRSFDDVILCRLNYYNNIVLDEMSSVRDCCEKESKVAGRHCSSHNTLGGDRAIGYQRKFGSFKLARVDSKACTQEENRTYNDCLYIASSDAVARPMVRIANCVETKAPTQPGDAPRDDCMRPVSHIEQAPPPMRGTTSTGSVPSRGSALSEQ